MLPKFANSTFLDEEFHLLVHIQPLWAMIELLTPFPRCRAAVSQVNKTLDNIMVVFKAAEEIVTTEAGTTSNDHAQKKFERASAGSSIQLSVAAGLF